MARALSSTAVFAFALLINPVVAGAADTRDLVVKLSQLTSCRSPSFSPDGGEIAFVADNPGKWLIHCHMLGHATSGMMTWFEVE